MAAANSIFKLKVETSEYDQKLANAAKGIRHLADVAHKADGDLTGLEKSELDYIRALGEMETKSRSASGQLRELSSTYKELKVIYDQLNEVEKADEGGKALAASLETLKQRAQEAKSQLDTATQSLNDNGEAGKGTSSVMQMLKEKFTINVDAIKLFNIGLQAAEGVLNVVKGAIASTETTYDALARATAVTDSVTNEFLKSLANADFSSFIYGLQGIIDKAIEAYNVMDEFESYAARFNPKQQAQEAEIQTKLMEARAAKAKGDKERAEQLTKEAKNIIEELSQTTKAYGEKQTAGGYAVIRSLMGTVDVSDQEIAWYADPKHWEEVTAAAESYRKKQEEIKKLSQGNITSLSYDQQSRSENIRRQRELEATITTRERQAYAFQNLRDSGNSEEAQAFQRALWNIYGTVLAESRVSSLRARADRMEGVLEGSGRIGGTTTRTGTKKEEILPEGSVAALTKQMQQLQKEQQLVTSYAGWQEYQQQIEAVSDRISLLKGELPKDKEVMFTVTAETSEALDKLRDIEGVMIDPKAVTVTAQTQEAIAALQRVDGLTIQPKTAEVTFHADDSDVLAKVRDIEGVTIDPKTLTVTAQTQEAVAALQRVDGLTIQPKTAEVTFRADDSDVLAKVRDIDGVKIDPKGVTVTAETSEALRSVQKLIGGLDGTTVHLKVKAVPQEMAIGTSIQNSAGLSSYISDLQKQLSTADFGTSLYNNLQAQLADTTTLQNLVGEALKVGLGTALFDVADETGADFWTRAVEGGVANIDWQAIIDQINEARKAAGLDAISLDFKTGAVSTDGQKRNPYLNRNEEGKMELKMTDALGGMASGIQNMAGGLEQLGIEIPQGLTDVVSGIQSVTNILSGIMSIVSVIQAIAGADAIIPFAGGGIVPHFAGGGLIGNAALGMTIPGHSYSGDLLRLPVDGGRGMIGVNSGEIIMNQAQAGILESELSGGRMRDINVHGVLQGENIVLAVSNYFRRTGKGEAAMWGKN